MQKTTKQAPAKKTPAGKSKQARTRKPLTPEQRMRKNKKDRERRARIRAGKLQQAGVKTGQAKSEKPVKPVKQANPKHVCKSAKPGRQKKCGGSCATPESVVAAICRHVLGAAAKSEDTSICKPVQEEAGVTRLSFKLADGSAVVLRVIDPDAVDPLSRFSPLPRSFRSALLAARMANEISAIVDRNIGMLG